MLLNGSAMHDFKEYASNEFNLDIFDEEKRQILFNKQMNTLPKHSRKHKVYYKQSICERAPEDCYSELGEEFEYQPWQTGGILNHPDFAHIKIKILCKTDIKVNYKSIEEAAMDGYNNYNKGCLNSKGNIYPFTGIRGDSKQLWRNIKILKTENRVEFVRASSYAVQKSAIKSSDVVIWACGYESRPLPVTYQNPLTNTRENLDFKKVGQNQFEVDDNLRLVIKNTNKEYNLFGIGLGYSLKTSNNHVKAEKCLNSRADGVRIYCSIIPFVLFKSLFPRKFFNRSIKVTIPDRALSMHRTTIKTNRGDEKHQRVNSVAKDVRPQIEPIQEVCSRPAKYKRSRHITNKNNDKVSKVYEEIKAKDQKAKKKTTQNKFYNKSTKKQKFTNQRTANLDLLNKNEIGDCNFESPVKMAGNK